MTNWLTLTSEQRKATIDQAAQLSGIPPKIIEKDWWVTLTLKALFQTPFGQYMAFKGGTSLSKGWKLIERFSEDIDIALSPEAIGMKYLTSPSKSQLAKLKKTGCQFTATTLKEALQAELTGMGVPEGMVEVVEKPIPADFPDTDPQILYVKYPAVTAADKYIPDEVKIEVTVRSEKMPCTPRPMLSLLSEHNPNPAYAETPFTIEVVEPRKTFIEKMMLLHEEFCKPDVNRVRTQRMSRHFSDLTNMSAKGIDKEAIGDHELYDHLQEHRRGYYRISWIDYDSLHHSRLSFLPPADVLEAYRADYSTMQEQMIYGASTSFDELMRSCKLIQGRLRMKREYKTIEEVIQIAEMQLEEKKRSNGADGNYSTIVDLISDPKFEESPANRTVSYRVKLTLVNTVFYFEEVEVITHS